MTHYPRLTLLGPEYQRVYGALLAGAHVAQVETPLAREAVSPDGARAVVNSLVAGHLAHLAQRTT